MNDQAECSFENIFVGINEKEQQWLIFDFLKRRLNPASLLITPEQHDFKEALFKSLLNEAMIEVCVMHAKEVMGDNLEPVDMWQSCDHEGKA